MSFICYKVLENKINCSGTIYSVFEPPLTPDDSEFWLYFGIYVLLTIGAGLMSGLTLGLLSLDTLSLEVLMKAGFGKEALYAEKLYPIIKHHHILLVTLLLGNAACVESMPIFLDRISDPITAIIVSVTAVLIFGEIIPQALCRKYGLAIGYYMRPLVYTIMFLFLIISYPISKMLDCLLGHDSGNYYKRSQLRALIDLHGPSNIHVTYSTGVAGDTEEGTSHLGSYPPIEIENDQTGRDQQNMAESERPLSIEEVTIIKGALDLTLMTAKDAQYPLDKVFMLSDEDVLNEDVLSKITQTAHSRIPIYHANERRMVRGILIAKMLLQINPDDNIIIRDLIKDSKRFRQLSYVIDSTPLYDLLQLFRTGQSSHMAVVVKDNIREEEIDALERYLSLNEGSEEMNLVSIYPPVTGIITLEDVLERLIKAEIKDESDLHRKKASRRVLTKQKIRRARSNCENRHRSRSIGDRINKICDGEDNVSFGESGERVPILKSHSNKSLDKRLRYSFTK